MFWIPNDYHVQFKQNVNAQADCHMSAWVLKVSEQTTHEWGWETYCLETITKLSAESLMDHQLSQAEILLPHLAKNRDFPELVQKTR